MFFSNTSMVSLPSKWFLSNNSSISDGPLKILGTLCSVLWLSCVKQAYDPYFSETRVSRFLLVPQPCCCSIDERVAKGCTPRQETAELPPQPTQRLTDLSVSVLPGLFTQLGHCRSVTDEGTCQRLWREARVRIRVSFPGCPVRVENRFLPFLHEVTETQCSTGSEFAAPGDAAVSTYLLQRFCHHCNWGGLLFGRLGSHDGISVKHLEWPLQLFSINKSPCAFRLAQQRVSGVTAAKIGLCTAAGVLGKACFRCFSVNMHGWCFSRSPCRAELCHLQNSNNHTNQIRGPGLYSGFKQSFKFHYY